MASYVNNSEKAENNRSSAYTLLIVGSIGFILVVLYFLDVIPVRGLNKYMISGVMGALFLLFIIMGGVSLRSARIFEKKAGSENNLTSEIKKWCMTNLSAKAIDESLHFDQEEEEAKYFARTERVKELISGKFMNLDQDYLERLADEIYASIFEKNGQEKETDL